MLIWLLVCPALLLIPLILIAVVQWLRLTSEEHAMYRYLADLVADQSNDNEWSRILKRGV
jgi:hypothetical protein